MKIFGIRLPMLREEYALSFCGIFVACHHVLDSKNQVLGMTTFVVFSFLFFNFLPLSLICFD